MICSSGSDGRPVDVVEGAVGDDEWQCTCEHPPRVLAGRTATGLGGVESVAVVHVGGAGVAGSGCAGGGHVGLDGHAAVGGGVVAELALIVVAGGPDGAVGFEGQGVAEAGGDESGAGEAAGLHRD